MLLLMNEWINEHEVWRKILIIEKIEIEFIMLNFFFFFAVRSYLDDWL